jgi:hypothetical protein
MTDSGFRPSLKERILGAYSGGAVLDFHQLPNYNACVLLKAF